VSSNVLHVLVPVVLKREVVSARRLLRTLPTYQPLCDGVGGRLDCTQLVVLVFCIITTDKTNCRSRTLLPAARSTAE